MARHANHRMSIRGGNLVAASTWFERALDSDAYLMSVGIAIVVATIVVLLLAALLSKPVSQHITAVQEQQEQELRDQQGLLNRMILEQLMDD